MLKINNNNNNNNKHKNVDTTDNVILAYSLTKFTDMSTVHVVCSDMYTRF
jgi:hypothetical protein